MFYPGDRIVYDDGTQSEPVAECEHYGDDVRLVFVDGDAAEYDGSALLKWR